MPSKISGQHAQFQDPQAVVERSPMHVLNTGGCLISKWSRRERLVSLLRAILPSLPYHASHGALQAHVGVLGGQTGENSMLLVQPSTNRFD